MTGNKLSLLGLCAKAGRLISGEEACIEAIRAGKAYLVVLDGSASENARKAIGNACAYYKVPMLETEPDALGRAVGKHNRKVAAVTDSGFAGAIAGNA